VPITAVAFDFGGVLTNPPFDGLEHYARRLGLPAQEFTQYFRGSPEMARLEIGAISSREFFKYVCVAVQADHNNIRVDIRALAAAAAAGECLRPDMIELVADVHRSCATALLTNNVSDAGWRASFPSHHFDIVVDSSDVGLRKPDPAIYELLIERLGRPAVEIAFIDDLAENLVPAAAAGILAIHFTNPETCRSALASAGVFGHNGWLSGVIG
jgi:epoxide hydrolase-like predicted phosphatase